jgi:mannonate dehydratase
MKPFSNSRRNILRSLGFGAAAAATPFLAKAETKEKTDFQKATVGLPPLKITKVKAIATCPHGIELIVVKVETSEPGLYGLGCATFRQRAHAVVAAIDKYLNDFCVGRDIDNIEDV